MATPTTLPATFVAGEVLTAAQMNNLRGAFRVLQVVYGETTTQATNSTTTYEDTGVTATITPSATSSKILVLTNTAIYSSSSGSVTYVQLLRGATSVALSIQNDSTSANFHQTSSILYYDSPATTSATTYKTQFKNGDAGKTSYVSNGNALSSIVLLEISA